MTTYLVILLLFCVPMSVSFFAETFFVVGASSSQLAEIHRLGQEGNAYSQIAAALNRSDGRDGDDQVWSETDVRRAVGRATANRWVRRLSITSPFAAVFSVPLYADQADRIALRQTPDAALAEDSMSRLGDWSVLGGYLLLGALLNMGLLAMMIWLFAMRWRISQ